MADAEGDSSTSFHRQRRDLFVISAILIIGQLAEITPHKLIFLGIDLDISNAARLMWALWALWVYWYLRFCQAFWALRRTPQGANLQRAFREELVLLINRHALNTAREHVQNAIKTNPQYQGFTPGITLNVQTRDLTWRQIEVHYLPQVCNPQNNQLSQLAETHYTIGPMRLWLYRARVTLRLSVARIEGTEYVFPFIFGLVPLAIFLRRTYM